MTKKDVYVVVDTPKKAKKLKKLLDMFGEKYSDIIEGILLSKDEYHPLSVFNNATFMDYKEWSVLCSPNDDKTEVSIKELRNILAKEHLKACDVVFMRSFKGEYESILKIKGVECEYLKVDKQLFVKGSDSVYSYGQEYIKDFIRYATPEEIALLEPKEVDKFAELKEAHKNGAFIQFKFGKDYWEDVDFPMWDDNYEYRIKPEEIKDSDIAIIEALHDVLLDNHKYDLNSKLLTNARELCKKLQNIVGDN